MTREKLVLGDDVRAEVWRRTIAAIDAYSDAIAGGAVLPTLGADAVRSMVARFDFATPIAPADAIDAVVAAMRGGQVHPTHPRYFGLFNPGSTTMGIAADALVAAFNPQLATHGHAPFAVEAERHLVRAFGERFGFARDSVEGTFTSGGAEANTTALLSALARSCPKFARGGARALAATPIIYASLEAHRSIEKAARGCGLGTDCVRRVAVDGAHRMRPTALRDAIGRDRAAGAMPLLVVATCGSTSAGAIDPLGELAAIAEKERCWLHVDAAWGGLAALVPELRTSIAGIERADSITFDAHKSLAVPMGAGMYISRHAGHLAETFRVSAEYMPRDAALDPYASSAQWSRRFIGLKLLLSLAVAGWDGYAAALREQVALGDALRARLASSGWRVLNDTPLPIVCFVDDAREDGRSGIFLDAMARAVAASAHAWISLTRLTNTGRALRACITNVRTTKSDVDALVDALDAARAAHHSNASASVPP
jgi:glutamate/tyrosine decarboxylase-like PLP-dependent enzyme